MAMSSIMTGVSSLMLFIVVLALHANEVQSEDNPGLQIRVSQSGLDYAANKAVDMFYVNVQTIPIQDFSTSVIKVKNIRITGAIKPLSNVIVSPGRLIWTLSDAGIFAASDWSYEVSAWLFHVRDSGTVTCSVTGSSISVSVGFGFDPFGHPTISSTGCSCDISSLSIKMSGGASLIYNALLDLFNKAIKNVLQLKICEAATAVINGKANDLLASFPLRKTVATDYAFDYSFTSPPDLQNGYLETKHKAIFFRKDHPIDPPILAPTFATTTTTDKMLMLWLSESVPNSIGYAIYEQKLLSYTVTNKVLPDGFKDFLSTTCSTEDNCVGNMLLELSRKYPKSAVELDIAVSEAPTTQISTDRILVKISGTVTCRIRFSSGSDVEVLKIDLELRISVSVALTAEVLRVKVLRIVPTMKFVSGSLSSISIGNLTQATDALLNSLLIPSFNEKGEEGMPLPMIGDVSLVDTDLIMQDHCLYIATNMHGSK